MAGSANVNLSLRVSGLGKTTLNLPDSFDGTTPTAALANKCTMGTAAEGEALDLGDVSTIEGVIIRAIDKVLDVDTTWDTTFEAQITIPVGQSVYFKPAGTVYVRENVSDETPAYEYIVYGT